ncbi:MAG: DUF6624 domain-containing protein [Ferruginibacter sp.]
MKARIILLGFIAILNSALGQDSTFHSVFKQLLSIDELDQRYRNQIDYIETKYGKTSAEINTLYKNMNDADSINLILVEAIIEKYGWLGYNQIGSQANTTLFMVIQHSDLKTWRKYLPIMQAAVKNGKAKTTQLVLLQDRLDLHEGRKQNYGSQIIWSLDRNKYLILPLNDPDNVDKRRAEMGLSTLAEYLSHWNIKWDSEAYKKELPIIMEECKKYFPKEFH